MESNFKDWRDYQLENEEIEMLESIENGEWQSFGNIELRRRNIRDFFSDKQDANKIINLCLPEEDFELILSKSNQYGMNYKELLEKLVHNFATGKVIL